MKKLRKYHKWPSIVVGLFVVLFSISGIIMNHRDIFSSFNFPRYLLPGPYQYKNWNLASIKGFTELNDSTLLAYGNVGIWKTDKEFKHFKDFNSGFPRGIDQKKIFTMIKSSNNRLFAGTLFGLYEFNFSDKRWVKIENKLSGVRIVKLLEKENYLYILTRSELYQMSLISGNELISKPIPPIEGSENRAGLFRTLWVVHSGEIFGITGKVIVDLVGLIVIFLTISGYFYFFLPKFSKRLSDIVRRKFQKVNRFSIKWHTLIGVYLLPVLLITVLTGMFLRPPLLIPIANKTIKPIAGTILSDKNVWNDKLRDFIYDSASARFIVSTSEGFITLTDAEQPVTGYVRQQPPVSVMGINAFERLSTGDIMVASFSGIYRWNMSTGEVRDHITGLPVYGTSSGNPFGAIAVAGTYTNNGTTVAIMDYGAGWINLVPGVKPPMPSAISASPISWWNLSLEIHTGRIFSFLIGNFYILYVPLMGITILLILITGLIMYLKGLKKRRRKASV